MNEMSYQQDGIIGNETHMGDTNRPRAKMFPATSSKEYQQLASVWSTLILVCVLLSIVNQLKLHVIFHIEKNK